MSLNEDSRQKRDHHVVIRNSTNNVIENFSELKNYYIHCCDVSSKSPIYCFLNDVRNSKVLWLKKFDFLFSLMYFCQTNIYWLVWMVPIASFRNDDYFSNCGSVVPLHIKWRILSFFYWVAPNFYDVFLILLTPPFINYHHLSVFSVSKNAWKFLSPRLRSSIFWNWEYWEVMIIDERWGQEN